MPATPITDPVTGESLVGTEPQLQQQVDSGLWRQRLNLFTGRTLNVKALDAEQAYRAGLLTTIGQSVSPGTLNGLNLTIDTSGADPKLVVTPGYGITASGQDVVLQNTMRAALSSLAVIDPVTGQQAVTFRESVGDPTNKTYAGILLLQPVIAQVSGQFLDTGTGPIEVSGNLGASCDQDQGEYAFEDWQIADAVRLVYLPWPSGVPALPLPVMTPQATWRNRLAYSIFEAESLLGPDDQLPWAMLGLPLGLIAFDPGIAWQANTAYSAGQFITDSNSNLQVVQSAGTSGGTEPAKWNTVFGGTTADGGVTWSNGGLAWKPLFVDCSSVVRAGGLPRRRYMLPAQPSPLQQWQPNTPFVVNDFIIDSNNNVQVAETAGTTGGPEPNWQSTPGQTTSDGSVTWKNNGSASWQANTLFTADQFIFDSNGNMQHVLTPGTSGSVQPVWNSVYLQTTDNSVIWINNGSGNPPIIQPALAQARVNQLSEQLSQVMAQQEPFTTLADIFATLPPSGILPAQAVSFVQQRAAWLPPNWSVSAAPVHLEELESVLETGMRLELLAAQTSAPADATLMEPVELLVPLPDALYDPNIFVAESVAATFSDEVAKATTARNVTLQQLAAVQAEINTLYTALGPNVPTNANLIDTGAGLTADELTGRDAPPPYLPTPSEQFGTTMQTTWAPAAAYTAGQFIIDLSGTVQVVQTAGTTGAATPSWNANFAGTTTDGGVTWLNNGSWAWQPNTPYVKGQFVIDPGGFMQVVATAGTSASSPPNWTQPENPSATTPDGIIWQPGGNARWQPDIQYNAGQLILDSNGNVQTAQTGGISGDWEPQWATNPGVTTQDSGVVWNNLGSAPWQASTAYSAGQAIVDSAGMIQVASIGGLSGPAAPAWNEAADATTVDAAVIWQNADPITWRAGAEYAAGQIILDDNGNLQLASVADANGSRQAIGTNGTSGTVPPLWNTTADGITVDGNIQWTLLAFFSDDLLQIKTIVTQPPYTSTFKDSTGTSQPISLLTADDLSNLQANGLQSLVTSLNSRISRANDLLDTAFLTTQTDIYRFRQNVLGATSATALATSPVLANIATGETASATADNLQTYINALQPPPSTTTDYTPKPPTFTPPVISPIKIPVVLANHPVEFKVANVNLTPKVQTLRSHAVLASLGSIKQVGMFTTPAGASILSPINLSGLQQAASGVTGTSLAGNINLISTGGISTVINRIPISQTNIGSIAGTFLGPIIGPAAGGTDTAGGGIVPGPTQTINQTPTAVVTPTDITSQSPLAGAQLNIRTLTIAERLAQSPSQEAMFYSIGNRLSFLQALQALESDLNLVADDLPILMDGLPTATTTAPAAVPVEIHTFSEWMSPNTQPALLGKVQSPYLVNDSAEATLFSTGVRVVEQHTMLLRALESRVQQYVDFVTLCTNAINSIQSNIQQAQSYVNRLQNALAQNRQDVAFTTALLADETQRVNSVNTERQQVLQDAVQLVAYTRARTLESIDTAPSRQLVPANVTNPVPACLQQSAAIPPELREIIGQLREAPVTWIPAVASLVAKLERPMLLQQLAVSAQLRASLQVQLPALPSSAAGENGVYASAISTVYSSNQQVFRSLQVQRASVQPAALTQMSWSTQVTQVQSIVAVNDLIAADAVHAEISNATARAVQQISSVATCLYTRVSAALPIERLGWAEYLSGAGISVQLQSLAILPGWNQLAYVDRQQMQMLVDWLFLQIDTSIPAATAFMSDVVRTAILLASDVPIDNIIPGSVVIRTQPSVGGSVSLNLSSARIASGMFVNLYSGSDLAARAVVSDLDNSTVQTTITDVFKPGVALETSDVAHLTSQIPQAVALRPLFM